MKLSSRIKSASPTQLCAGAMLLALLAGCERDDVKVQRVPKDSRVSAQPAEAPAAQMEIHPRTEAALPRLTWTLPSGWREKPPSTMRAASFTVPGANGQSADVGVIPLASGGPEMELANLNMWRTELQLPPVEKAETVPVAIGSESGKLFELASAPPAAGAPSDRILVATITRGDTSWYFKMKGGDSLVQEQKPAFLQFLKSISFAGSTSTTAAPAAAPTMSDAGKARPGSTLPAGWQEVPASQFLIAQYLIQGNDGAKADVNVSVLAGEGGGLLANLNRWRGQLGLTPMAETDVASQTSAIDVAGRKATVADLSGTNARTGKKARLVGVIVPEAGQTKFYKLMGDEQIVEQQKEPFLKFVQNAQEAHAP